MLSLASIAQRATLADMAEATNRSQNADSPTSHPDSTAAMRRDDWEALFRAVTVRLHQHVEDLAWAGTGVGAGSVSVSEGLRRVVERVEPLRECVAALQQLLCELDGHPAEAPTLRQLCGNVGTRAQLEQHLARSLHAAAGGAPAPAVLCLGLDGFARINEQYGRDLGTLTLNIVARRLAHSLRAQDMVCRLDGDRFACLLHAPTDREQLSRVACTLFDAVAAPLRAGTVTLSVLPSIGIAVGPADGDTGPLLLSHADAAMGRAQRRQQGYVFFDPRSDR